MGLGFVKSIVSGLFFSDGGLELVQLSGDGIQRSTSLKLGLNLGEENHDTSLGGEVQGILVEHGSGGSTTNENDKADSEGLHLF